MEEELLLLEMDDAGGILYLRLTCKKNSVTYQYDKTSSKATSTTICHTKRKRALNKGQFTCVSCDRIFFLTAPEYLSSSYGMNKRSSRSEERKWKEKLVFLHAGDKGDQKDIDLIHGLESGSSRRMKNCST